MNFDSHRGNLGQPMAKEKSPCRSSGITETPHRDDLLSIPQWCRRGFRGRRSSIRLHRGNSHESWHSADVQGSDPVQRDRSFSLSDMPSSKGMSSKL